MSTDYHYRLFDTAFGPCGLAWGEDGIVSLRIPGEDAATIERRLRQLTGKHAPSTPPKVILHAIVKIQAYLDGRDVSFDDVKLDVSACEPLHQKVYAAARALPYGRTMTYGEMAKSIGQPEGARDVGYALSRNPIAIIIPCHRILAAGNQIGGFSAYGGTKTKERLLILEGASFAAPPAKEKKPAGDQLQLLF
ncbi:methylated-DNA--[protein]-cysteine S-methyltransferase [Methylovirgula sp. 4M-Z18]|uniref:methylated-DNA--[protein]-cysteine S-methyltransferase n=1 Tax=Methylovirgula sp. 4M-Z18 TaxID=2293567 RepID=UPI000E2F652F|nr:methylated-DNA--[protein]-cysteine S-methyltransferase [Methylovirgula sp. 4M-Z18]RFB78751.1 methylated-DNA--[protein]-cysteine S-methyltransferase [Methylovirgula sp. 4M-Z18]